MLRTLRILIVAAAALSTVVAGLRDALAEAPATGPSVRAIDGDALDCSREDDSGTCSEQVEEDDCHEQHEREIHLFATTSLAVDLASSIAFPAAPSRSAAADLLSRATLSRGPPSSR